MARIGYKKAKYNEHDSSTKKFKTLGTSASVPALERVIDESFSPEFASGELYADDVLAESYEEFKKGTITITTADDDEDIEAKFLGHTRATDETIKKIDDSAPYFGYGHIITKIVKGVKSFKVEFFPKVKWTKITTNAKTKGENIEYGTTSYEGSVLPLTEEFNGMDAGVWEMHKVFTDESDAEAYLNACLSPYVSSGSGG